MSCEECETRARLLREAEELLRDKRFKYRDAEYFKLPRLLGSYEHAVAQARANVEHHLVECEAGNG